MRREEGGNGVEIFLLDLGGEGSGDRTSKGGGGEDRGWGIRTGGGGSKPERMKEE